MSLANLMNICKYVFRYSCFKLFKIELTSRICNFWPENWNILFLIKAINFFCPIGEIKICFFIKQLWYNIHIYSECYMFYLKSFHKNIRKHWMIKNQINCTSSVELFKLQFDRKWENQDIPSLLDCNGRNSYICFVIGCLSLK